MVKNIIFDWAGTLSDDIMAVYSAAMIVFQKFGAEKITLHEFKKEWEQPFMIFYNKFVPDLSIEQEKNAFEKAYNVTRNQYPANPFYGISEFLNQAKLMGKNLIIISSDPEMKIMKEVKDYQFVDYFSHVYHSVYDKSNVIEEVIKKHNFKRNETIFIGDTTHEINVSKKSGIISGAVTWGYQLEGKLRECKPDYLFKQISDLKKIIN